MGRELERFTGKLIQSSIGQFWGITQDVLLENSSKRKHLVESNISRILFTHPDQMLHIIYGISQRNRMDEFSSKTACVTTRKMKISEIILDEFSMICQ